MAAPSQKKKEVRFRLDAGLFAELETRAGQHETTANKLAAEIVVACLEGVRDSALSTEDSSFNDGPYATEGHLLLVHEGLHLVIQRATALILQNMTDWERDRVLDFVARELSDD